MKPKFFSPTTCIISSIFILIIDGIALIQLHIFSIPIKPPMFVVPTFVGFVFGCITSLYFYKIRIKNIEKINIYISTMSGVNHLMNNLLNNFQIFLFQKNPLDKEQKKMVQFYIQETSSILKELSDLKDVDSKRIDSISLQNVTRKKL